MISSFLTNRTKKVTIDNIYSDWLWVKQSIPQGNVIGAIFYTSTIFAIIAPNKVEKMKVVKRCKWKKKFLFFNFNSNPIIYLLVPIKQN